MNDFLTQKIIGAAIEVHRILGSGLLESTYEEALCYELNFRNINFQKQPEVASAQILSYLKATGFKRGLLINFGVSKLVDGVKRFSL